jgi:hypothetical protein
VRFILLLVFDQVAWAEMTPTQSATFDQDEGRFNEELRSKGAWLYGEGLGAPEQARTLRFDGTRPSVSDGPSSAAKEQLAGFWVIKATDLDDAVAWASRMPLPTGAIEVRPLR